ncbi:PLASMODESMATA CALLOSE-BINDING PROTEIN 5-like [Pyrus ussuriensis x Pyrus communis]|uniref:PLASMODESMATA CALLOSE-BINDING PROTEIN 5-like n=1 Tax=Pyrus ussuriensis x Pyrus communis TaxID=2448454 RepID=A0A5N5GP98_9ROSA|nr:PLASMODESMATA CALLOSE-BINDING PROTEIN 5-like [Pyrus x bretschneideri]KAB2612564.1 PLASMODESMATA CALLOSE-BINDING PROTEIN 5-like [Pyrus ussuriensis x Pyrus communis]
MHKSIGLSLILSLTLFCHLIPPSKAKDGVVKMELWCVAKNNAEDAPLVTALNWACGPGGADCRPIQQGGPCYDPADIQNTASYAFNDYFLKHGMTADSCSFDNTAALTSLNPSHDKCKFPSSLSASNASISSASTAIGNGMGRSEDLNGSNMISEHWIWPVLASFLVIAYNTWAMG